MSDHVTQAVTTFDHRGPGGDEALALAHPEAVATLHAIQPGTCRTLAGVEVQRQANGAWCVGGDANLASPWVAVQSLRSALNNR